MLYRFGSVLEICAATALAWWGVVHFALGQRYVAARSRTATPRRGTRAANIEKLEKELEKHLLAARDHAHALCDRGAEAVLLPRPTQKELAQRTGLTEPDVSRCLNDDRAKVLRILWDTANSLDAVMSYKRRP